MVQYDLHILHVDNNSNARGSPCFIVIYNFSIETAAGHCSLDPDGYGDAYSRALAGTRKIKNEKYNKNAEGSSTYYIVSRGGLEDRRKVFTSRGSSNAFIIPFNRNVCVGGSQRRAAADGIGQ